MKISYCFLPVRVTKIRGHVGKGEERYQTIGREISRATVRGTWAITINNFITRPCEASNSFQELISLQHYNKSKSRGTTGRQPLDMVMGKELQQAL